MIRKLLTAGVIWGAICGAAIAQTSVPASAPVQGQSPIAPNAAVLIFPDVTTGIAHVVRPGDPLPIYVPAGFPVPVSPSSATQAASTALSANLVVKASTGSLFSFDVVADSTLSGSAWYVMIYNATSAPADGAVTPAKCYAMPAGVTTASASFPSNGSAFTTGIVIGVGTTGCLTKTASTHAFISGDYE